MPALAPAPAPALASAPAPSRRTRRQRHAPCQGRVRWRAGDQDRELRPRVRASFVGGSRLKTLNRPTPGASPNCSATVPMLDQRAPSRSATPHRVVVGARGRACVQAQARRLAGARARACMQCVLLSNGEGLRKGAQEGGGCERGTSREHVAGWGEAVPSPEAAVAQTARDKRGVRGLVPAAMARARPRKRGVWHGCGAAPWTT